MYFHTRIKPLKSNFFIHPQLLYPAKKADKSHWLLDESQPKSFLDTHSPECWNRNPFLLDTGCALCWYLQSHRLRSFLLFFSTNSSHHHVFFSPHAHDTHRSKPLPQVIPNEIQTAEPSSLSWGSIPVSASSLAVQATSASPPSRNNLNSATWESCMHSHTYYSLLPRCSSCTTFLACTNSFWKDGCCCFFL